MRARARTQINSLDRLRFYFSADCTGFRRFGRFDEIQKDFVASEVLRSRS